MYMFKTNYHGHNLNKNYRGYDINMIVLNRENIINGLIELRKEEDRENRMIVDNIKSIVNLKDISDLEKLKLINNELGKIVFDETI